MYQTAGVTRHDGKRKSTMTGKPCTDHETWLFYVNQYTRLAKKFVAQQKSRAAWSRDFCPG